MYGCKAGERYMYVFMCVALVTGACVWLCRWCTLARRGVCTRAHTHTYDPRPKDTRLRLVVALGGALGLLLEALALDEGGVELGVGVADLALGHEELEAVLFLGFDK